jgi:hypothetical protein
MKKNRFIAKTWNVLAGVLALALAFGLVLALTGCDNGSTTPDVSVTYTGTANGSKYTLTITKSAARYAAAAGDDYTLKSGGKTSTGMVQNVSGTGSNLTFTLIPSGGGMITTKVSAAGITEFATIGTVTWDDDGGTVTLPTTVTPPSTNDDDDDSEDEVALTWTVVTDTGFGADAIHGIAYGGGKFVAVGGDGKAAYSTDGVSWTAVDDTVTGFGEWDSIRGIAYGGGRFVAVGYSYGADYHGQAAYSTDGVTWWAVTDTTFGSNPIIGIAYGGATGQKKFVAVGNNGKAAYSATGTGTWTALTADQTTFKSESTYFDINAIAYGGAAGQEKFVAVGESGKAAYSATGTGTWTAVTDTKFGSDDINGIAYGGGKFVAVGAKGKAAYSADGGATWTAVTVPGFGEWDSIRGIAYGGGKFVTVGDRGNAAYSEDGVSWAVTDTKFGISSRISINGTAYGGKKFVAVGSGGKIAYSNDQEE